MALSLSTYLHCSVVKTGTWTSLTQTLSPQGGLPLSVWRRRKSWTSLSQYPGLHIYKEENPIISLSLEIKIGTWCGGALLEEFDFEHDACNCSLSEACPIAYFLHPNDRIYDWMYDTALVLWTVKMITYSLFAFLSTIIIFSLCCNTSTTTAFGAFVSSSSRSCGSSWPPGWRH